MWNMRLYQRKHTGVWYVGFERGKSRSLKTKDRAEARRLFKVLEKEALAGRLREITGAGASPTLAAYLATGRRRSELLALCWEDVDWERGLYYVRRAKRNLSRYYPMSSTLRAILEHLGPQRTGPVFDRWKSPDTVSKKIKAALRAAGFEDCRLHDLRHTFAVRYISERGSLRHLQELLGHTEYRTTEIYAHVVQGEMNDEVLTAYENPTKSKEIG